MHPKVAGQDGPELGENAERQIARPEGGSSYVAMPSFYASMAVAEVWIARIAPPTVLVFGLSDQLPAEYKTLVAPAGLRRQHPRLGRGPLEEIFYQPNLVLFAASKCRPALLESHSHPLRRFRKIVIDHRKIGAPQIFRKVEAEA
jgi:hypothetical protein